MGISLIVATVGRAEELRRLLHSLVGQSARAFEVIVVDQNEDDRLRPVLAEFEHSGLRIRHHRQTEQNLSRARNAGLRLASHEIVAFPDDDCWYDPDVVEQALDAFADPQVDGVVGHWMERGRPETQARALSWQLTCRFRDIDASSIEIFMRRAAILAAGGFDESLGVTRWFGSGEETDLVMRLLRGGRHVVHLPQIRVHHPWVPELSGTPKERWARIRSRARGTGALYAKHQLPATVVCRGLVAPIVRCFLPPYGTRQLVTQLATLLGRWEGFIRWRLQDPAH